MVNVSDRAYVYLVEPNRDSALIGWQAALAGRESARANVVLLGDAKVEGYPTTDFARTPAQELARALRAKFPTPGLSNTGGRGRIGVPSQGISPPLPSPLTFNGGIFDPVAYNVTPTLHFGAAHTCWYTNTVNHRVTFTLAANETSFDLVHVAGPTGHTTGGYYKVNGGPAFPFSTYNATTQLRTLHVGSGIGTGGGGVQLPAIVDGGVPSGGTVLVSVDGGTPSSSFTATVDGGTSAVGGTTLHLDGGLPVNTVVGSGGYDGGTPTSLFAGVLDGGTPVVQTGGDDGDEDPLAVGATIEIGCSGSGYLIVSELILYGGDESSGIMVHGVGHAGYKCVDFSSHSTTPAGWREAIANLDPDVIILEVGTNDAAANSASAFRTSLQALVTAIRSVGGPIPTVPILLASPYNSESAGVFVDPWMNYVAEMGYVANLDALIAFVNEADRMPDTNALSSFGLYHSDHIHGNANGKAYAMQAQILSEALSFG